jgi:hypothetical protein
VQSRNLQNVRFYALLLRVEAASHSRDPFNLRTRA